MNVIKAKNLTTPRPVGPWMSKLRTSMRAFAGPGHPVADCLYDENWPGRQAVHCLYSLSLKTLIDDNLKDLSSVDTPLCWRFIAAGHKTFENATACWTPHESSGLTAKISCTLSAPELAGILEGAEALNDLDQVSKGQYQLRVLRIPALYLEAFWLKSRNPEDDWIVPYGLNLDGDGAVKVSQDQTFQRGVAMPVADFLAKIRGSAQQRHDAGTKAAQARCVRAKTHAQDSPLH